jgi:hypothetical protein
MSLDSIDESSMVSKELIYILLSLWPVVTASKFKIFCDCENSIVQ